MSFSNQFYNEYRKLTSLEIDAGSGKDPVNAGCELDYK